MDEEVAAYRLVLKGWTATTPLATSVERSLAPVRAHSSLPTLCWSKPDSNPRSHPTAGSYPNPDDAYAGSRPLLSKGANIEVVSFFRLVRNAGGYDRLLT